MYKCVYIYIYIYPSLKDAVVTLMEEVQDQASRLGSLTEGLRRLAAAVEKDGSLGTMTRLQS